MTLENKPEDFFINTLAGVFIGGRISGWVERNRQKLFSSNVSEIELDLLYQLSPSFAEATHELPVEKRILGIKMALQIADSKPLSATVIKKGHGV